MIVICPMAGVGLIDHPLVFSKPKPLFKIAGKYLIEHTLDYLKQILEKNSKICFILGYKKHIIAQYITDHYSDYFNIFYFEQKPMGYKKDFPYFSGLGDAILLAKEIASGEDCLIVLGDRLPIDGFGALYNKFLEKKCDILLNTATADKPQLYGICEFDQKKEKIIKVIEKPKNFVSNIAIAGSYIFSKKITVDMFKMLQKQALDPQLNGKNHDFTTIINQMINNGCNIEINQSLHPIIDFGRFHSILEGHKELLKNQAAFSHNENLPDQKKASKLKKTEGENVTIIQPVYIGKDTLINNSIIGPNVSIGDHSMISNCIIKESIIGDFVSVKDMITYNSLIGNYVSIESMLKSNVIIGDSSTLGISEKKII